MRNGAGVYNLVTNTWFPPINGVLATSSDWSPFIQDIASALTQSVSNDGQTTMIGNLPMGNNKITGLQAGTANTDAVNLSQVNSNAGQGRLVKVGANLVLQPYQGNRLTINGVVYTIPAAGVSLAPAGAVATTLYFIYAFMVGAVMTLEYSTTGHSTDTTTGVEIKTGDATRTLVGMARPIGGPAWVDTVTQRFVLSYFNRRNVGLSITMGASSGVFSLNVYQPIPASVTLLEFLTWGDETFTFSFNGFGNTNVACNVFVMIGLDAANTAAAIGISAATVGNLYAANPTLITSSGEGYHKTEIYEQQNTTATFTFTGGSLGLASTHAGTIRG